MRTEKISIDERFADRAQAQRYHDRFKSGRRRRTHAREERALEGLLARLGRMSIVMDVGSGAGRFIEPLARFADRVIQADYSAHMLAVARDSHSVPLGGCDFVNADARALPFPDGSADFVFCHRLLNHFPESSIRRKMLSELCRVSRRWVTVSCLTPPAPVRRFRQWYDQQRGRASVDGHVSATALCHEAGECGLTLVERVRIRTVPVVGEFFVFAKPGNDDRDDGRPADVHR